MADPNFDTLQTQVTAQVTAPNQVSVDGTTVSMPKASEVIDLYRFSAAIVARRRNHAGVTFQRLKPGDCVG